LCAATTYTSGKPPAALAVLGLRADFYGRCAAYPELVEALRHGQVLLGAMRAVELRDAIEKPARAVGIDIEPGLVEVMLADLGADSDPKETDGHCYEPGALPLLAHALFATWLHREGQRLTLDSYRLAGGINGGIAATAERTYALLSPDEQRVARRLLLRMVQIGDGTDDIRRPLDFARLADESADSATTATVLEALTNARLIIVDEKVVQITHEALLRAWPQMRSWIDGDRTRLLVHQRLADAAQAWDSEGRHPAELHRGPGSRPPASGSTLTTRTCLPWSVTSSRPPSKPNAPSNALRAVVLVVFVNSSRYSPSCCSPRPCRWSTPYVLSRRPSSNATSP